MTEISRRSLLKVTSAVGAALIPTASAVAAESKHGQHEMASSTASAPGRTVYLFLNTQEVAFVEAAVSRLIPVDEKWPGALEAGVPNYIDKQLAGAWGAGERLYRSGPWHKGEASQGYQLPFTPAELFRKALAVINREPSGAAFPKMRPEQQDEFLKELEAGGRDLDGVPSNVFFEHLWKSTVEGFFSDPVYGGNHNMTSWRMVGFPGAYGSYYDLVDQHGIAIQREPVSLAEDANGMVHMHPGIPASIR